MNIHYLLALVIFSSLVFSEEPITLAIPGHVNIGVLTQLRHDSNDSNNCGGAIKAWSLQEVAALEWALSTINNQTNQDFSVGLQVYDNCGNKDILTRQSVKLLENVQNSTNPLIGIISLGELPSIKTVVSLLHAYSLPLMTTQTPSETILNDENVFTTAPHLHAQIQAVLSVVRRQKRHSGILEREHRLGVVSGCQSALQILENMAQKSGIEVHSSIIVETANKTKLTDDTSLFLKSQVGFQGTVILLLQTSFINDVVENLDPILVKRAESFWIFSILDGEPAENTINFKKISETFHMSTVVEPFSPLLSGLSLHLINSLTSNTSIISTLTDLVPPIKVCSNQNQLGLVKCEDVKTFPMLSGTRATSVIKAISTLVAAFRLVQIDRCPNNAKCHHIFDKNLGNDMVQSLMKLSYNAQEASDNIRYTADGRFVTSFIISRVHSTGLEQVGKYREDTGIVWTHLLPGMKPHKTKMEIINPKGSQIKTYTENDENFIKSEDFLGFEEYTKDDGIIKEILYTQEDKIGMLYALSVLVWASIGILSSLYIGVVLAYKTWDGPLASSEVLESILLSGMTCCFLSCILFVLPPNLVMCRLRIMIPSISLSICFGVILLKTMQMRASETLGAAGNVSKVNLYVTLVLIVGIQMALSLISQKDLLEEKRSTPVVELGPNGIRMCRRETLPALIMQEYLLILLVFSLVLSLTHRNLTNEIREDRRLLHVSAFSTILIVVWMVITITLPTCEVLTGTCVICLIITTSILLIVYCPKMFAVIMEAKKFKHKKLAASSLSSVFKPTETGCSVHTLRPPPPFCDPPRSYKFGDMSPMRPWRLDPYDSPILHHSIPPPPPPPIRDYYYSRSNGRYQ